MRARDALSAEYGVLGVGEIATAIVTGLCDAIERPPQILLSPCNTRRVAALVTRCPSASIAPDNQTVIDRCAVVVLAVRPQDASTILTGLAFRSDQPIVSVDRKAADSPSGAQDLIQARS